LKIENVVIIVDFYLVSSLNLLEQLLDIAGNLVGSKLLIISSKGGSGSWIDEELLKIPTNIARVLLCVKQRGITVETITGGRAASLQEGVDWVTVLTIDIDSDGQGEFGNETIAGSDVLDGIEDLRGVACWLLVLKLCTREADDLNSIAELILETIEQRILDGGLTEGGHIHQQQGLALEAGEIQRSQAGIEILDGILVDAVVVGGSRAVSVGLVLEFSIEDLVVAFHKVKGSVGYRCWSRGWLTVGDGDECRNQKELHGWCV